MLAYEVPAYKLMLRVKKSDRNTVEKRQSPRLLTLTLPSSKRPSFELEHQKCAIRSIGQDGLEVWVSSLPLPLKSGDVVQGEFSWEGRNHPVQLRVIRRSGGAEGRGIGLEILKKTEDLDKILKEIAFSINNGNPFMPLFRIMRRL